VPVKQYCYSRKHIQLKRATENCARDKERPESDGHASSESFSLYNCRWPAVFGDGHVMDDNRQFPDGRAVHDGDDIVGDPRS